KCLVPAAAPSIRNSGRKTNPSTTLREVTEDERSPSFVVRRPSNLDQMDGTLYLAILLASDVSEGTRMDRDVEVISSIERQAQILQFIEQRQRVTVAQICDQFSVSPATARRDLDALAEQGKIQRVHGGAIPIRQAPPELPVLHRLNEQS